MKKVIVTNGSGQWGKDTFAKILNKHIPLEKYSSIDLVKVIATYGEWDGGKTEKDRKFLSDLKILFSDYNDLPYRDVCKKIIDFQTNNNKSKLILVDIREPKEIDRVKKNFNAITVLVKNDNVNIITSNSADANVLNYQYDYVVDNTGDLKHLQNEVIKFINYLIEKGVILSEEL